MAKMIDIRTAQQVVLSYELAPAGRRVLATIVDLAVMGLAIFVVYYMFEESLALAWLLFIIPGFYHLIFESAMNGRSPGKLMAGIRVMRTDGATLEFTDCFLRWIMRPLDLTFSAGVLAMFMVMGTEKRQRLGDLMAGTAVVSKKQTLHYTYNELMKLHESRSSIEITWPQLRHIEEKHILFIKNILGSRGQYTEAVYRKALDSCARKMSTLLGIHTPPEDPATFLQQVVQEYIVLTR